MLDEGLGAKLAWVDAKRLGAGFEGREFDRTLLDDLPSTLTHAARTENLFLRLCRAPILRSEIAIEGGETSRRDQIAFADLLAVDRGRQGEPAAARGGL
jgi:hypothetical protein